MKLNRFKMKQKKGFTLMEVLVASSIFAVILVVITGTIIQSGGYQTKLRAITENAEQTRKITDVITTNVREANANIIIWSECPSLATIQYKSGVALLAYDGATLCPVVDSLTPAANLLVISKNDKYKIYLSFNNKVYYKEIGNTAYVSLTTIRDMVSPLPSLPAKAADYYQFSKIDLTTSIQFYGSAPYDVNALNRPIIKFIVESYSSNSGSFHSQIRSAVTPRNFN